MLGIRQAAGWRGPALAGLVVAAALALPFLVGGYYVQFATKVMIMGIAAMGLNLAVGFGGMVSLCHAAFYGLAGYVLALATPRYDPASLFVTLPLALAVAALAALAIGALSLRTRGVYFIMVTLAFGQMLFFVFFDTDVAGGSDGAYIYSKPEIAVGGRTLLDLERPLNLYLLVLTLTAATALLLVRLTLSPFGQALAAARHNERRALSLGFPVYRIRLVAFVISGVLAGLAGYFAAAQFGFVAPQMLGWHLSAIMLVMVVLGGLGSVTGPLIGAVVLLGLEEVLKAWTPYWAILEGAIIFAIVLGLPGGVGQLADLVMGPAARNESAPAPHPVSARNPGVA